MSQNLLQQNFSTIRTQLQIEHDIGKSPQLLALYRSWKPEQRQEYYFIPLDIFRKNIHNKGIHTELDAGLSFLACYEPEDILNLLKAFPEFKVLYDEVYEICKNTERVMSMFPKELQEMDRNTVQYMIDVMQDEIDESKRGIAEQT